VGRISSGEADDLLDAVRKVANDFIDRRDNLVNRLSDFQMRPSSVRAGKFKKMETRTYADGDSFMRGLSETFSSSAGRSEDGRPIELMQVSLFPPGRSEGHTIAIQRAFEDKTNSARDLYYLFDANNGAYRYDDYHHMARAVSDYYQTRKSAKGGEMTIQMDCYADELAYKRHRDPNSDGGRSDGSRSDGSRSDGSRSDGSR
jgi:hypothetical protein